ncbi:hypothetical protein B566_EDAN011517 [Ephemera danica]|nr:hypothetical protein B566_EDAN011517 [Ephemera danica]
MNVIEASGNTKVLTPPICERLKDVGGPSGCSKLAMDTSSRSSKKRKRAGGRKSRSAVPSCDDSDVEQPTNEEPIDPQRKKRQRRRKNRKYKPYNKLSWQERHEQEDRETRRANRVRAQRFANGQPVAPYNTTQFLMEDHNDLKDIDGPPPHNPPLFPRCQRPQRCRDSSFSLDSEEDFYYSSPEDEKEFLTKEFSSAYEDLHAEQLNAQPKTKLVQDILNLEKKVDGLEKELTEVRCKDRSTSENEEGTSDERAVLYKAEITKLSEENNRLRAENECLRRRCFGEDAELHCSSSSIDTDSDSTASSSGSCSASCSSYDSNSRGPSKSAAMVTENSNPPYVEEPNSNPPTEEPNSNPPPVEEPKASEEPLMSPDDAK